MELEERIKKVLSYEKTKSVWRKKHDSKEFQEASRLNKDLYGKPLNRQAKCECIEDLFFLLSGLNKQKINQKKVNMTRKFEIKKDKMIQLFNQNDVYTDANITDEKAIELLKSSPGLIKFFSKFPADWRDLAAGFKHKKPSEAPKGEEKAPAKTVELSRKETLMSQSDKELEATATAFNLPKKEWKKLKGEKLVDYIIKKIPA